MCFARLRRVMRGHLVSAAVGIGVTDSGKARTVHVDPEKRKRDGDDEDTPR